MGYCTLFIAFVLLVSFEDSLSQTPAVTCGQSGEFCGMGPTRKNCCEGYTCDVAPNDAYADCVKINTTCAISGQFCGRGPTRKDCCAGYRCDVAPDDSHAFCVRI